MQIIIIIIIIIIINNQKHLFHLGEPLKKKKIDEEREEREREDEGKRKRDGNYSVVSILYKIPKEKKKGKKKIKKE